MGPRDVRVVDADVGARGPPQHDAAGLDMVRAAGVGTADDTQPQDTA
jgi:hypothetical protein